jgi:hypothetical protein
VTQAEMSEPKGTRRRAAASDAAPAAPSAEEIAEAPEYEKTAQGETTADETAPAATTTAVEETA